MIAARNLKTPLSQAMYYTGSVKWMEVRLNFCVNIFHNLTLWRLKQHLTFHNAVFVFFTNMISLQISHGQYALRKVDLVRFRYFCEEPRFLKHPLF